MFDVSKNIKRSVNGIIFIWCIWLTYFLLHIWKRKIWLLFSLLFICLSYISSLSLLLLAYLVDQVSTSLIFDMIILKDPVSCSCPYSLSPSTNCLTLWSSCLLEKTSRLCLQLPSSLSISLQNLCSLSLSAWPFVSSVDLVMISVTDQSPLAEIWGHSGSWECCNEEFDVCTAICNE